MARRGQEALTDCYYEARGQVGLSRSEVGESSAAVDEEVRTPYVGELLHSCHVTIV